MELALKRGLLLRLGHFDVLGLGKSNLFFPFSCSEFVVSEDFSDSTKTVPSPQPPTGRVNRMRAVSSNGGGTRENQPSRTLQLRQQTQ